MFDFLVSEVHAIGSAPTVFILGILIAGAVIWRIINWHYKGRFDTSEARIKLAHETAADLDRKIKQLAAELEKTQALLKAGDRTAATYALQASATTMTTVTQLSTDLDRALAHRDIKPANVLKTTLPST